MSLRIMVCRVGMRRWARARTAWPKAFALAWFALVVGPGDGVGVVGRRRAEANMARLSLLLPPWETCSPLMEEPDLLVTGARPA